MGLKKNYLGYKSFDYLEKDIDYKAFKLAKEIDRVEPYLVPLSAPEEERVNRIVDENPVISLHDHIRIIPEDVTELPEYSRQGRMTTAFEAISNSCLDCVFENLMDGWCKIVSQHGWKWDDVLYDLGMKLSDLAHQDLVIIATRVDDILRAHKEGKVAFVMCIEGAAAIENEVDRIDILYGFGVRELGLVFSESNTLGTGIKEDRDGGLTYFGRECIERMNKLGMAIDVSHSSVQTILDAVEASKKPVFATHTGARALWNIKPLKPDHVLKAIADKGGVIGIMASPGVTVTVRHPEHNIESVMEHFEYVKSLVGIDHVAFGPDTLYGDHVGLHILRDKPQEDTLGVIKSTKVPYVKGLENPTEASWNIIRWLVKHGYSDGDISKVIGGNIISILREVWY